MQHHAKPFLKWAGGKTGALARLDEYIPRDLSGYYEPFLGGGSVLLHVLASLKNGQRRLLPGAQIVASDINAALINVYKRIQADPEPLIHELCGLFTQAQEAPSIEEFYYVLRDLYNQHRGEDTDYAAALFLFLNHNGFRGLYRENKAGEFNVPYGHYKTPVIPHASTLRNAHSLFTEYRVIFKCQNASAVLEEVPDVADVPDVPNANPPPCVFLDPPYEKLAPNTFIAYYAGGADYSVGALCDWMRTRGRRCHAIMTNHLTPELADIFRDFPVCETFSARRAINAKKPESQADELIVCGRAAARAG